VHLLNSSFSQQAVFLLYLWVSSVFDVTLRLVLLLMMVM